MCYSRFCDKTGLEGGSSINKNRGSELGSSPNLQLFPVHCIASHAQVPFNAMNFFPNELTRMRSSVGQDPRLLLVTERLMLASVSSHIAHAKCPLNTCL